MKAKLKDLVRIHQALTLLDKDFDLSGGAIVGMARNFRLIRGELTDVEKRVQEERQALGTPPEKNDAAAVAAFIEKVKPVDRKIEEMYEAESSDLDLFKFTLAGLRLEDKTDEDGNPIPVSNKIPAKDCLSVLMEFGLL